MLNCSQTVLESCYIEMIWSKYVQRISITIFPPSHYRCTYNFHRYTWKFYLLPQDNLVWQTKTSLLHPLLPHRKICFCYQHWNQSKILQDFHPMVSVAKKKEKKELKATIYSIYQALCYSLTNLEIHAQLYTHEKRKFLTSSLFFS